MPNLMTEREVEACEARADASTQGPWMKPLANIFRVVSPDQTLQYNSQTKIICDTLCEANDKQQMNHAGNADFIAASRIDVPRLCATAQHAMKSLREVLCDSMTCSCHEAYTNRNMIDPGCGYHDNLDAVTTLNTYYDPPAKPNASGGMSAINVPSTTLPEPPNATE